MFTGIVPIVCEELFKAKELKEKTVQKGEELQASQYFCLIDLINLYSAGIVH